MTLRVSQSKNWSRFCVAPGNRVRNQIRIFAYTLLFIWLPLQQMRATQGLGETSLPAPAKGQVDFQRDVEPLLRERCQGCHGPEKQMGGLRLDNKIGALTGGSSGPVIKPGDSAHSKLI